MKKQKRRPDLTRHYLLLVLLLGLVAFTFIVVRFFAVSERAPLASVTNMDEDDADIRMGRVSAPAYTQEIAEKLKRYEHFDTLISYTREGFEPREIRVKKGATIRFTNNSRDALWVSASGTKLYPEQSSLGCGSSSLDSCGKIEFQDFWEFNVMIVGTWEVQNSLNKDDRMRIIVTE